MIRILAASAALLFGVTVAVAAGRPGKVTENDRQGVLDIVAAQVEANDEIQSHYKVCPAEIANAARPFWRELFPGEDISRESCGEDIKACYRTCMEEGSAAACLALGYTLQAASPVVSPLWSQMLFAQACAAGSSGGCTNRAAGIRNGQFSGDPMLNAERDHLRGCFLRTFTLTCNEDDPWGCTMLGQSYQYGEGAPADRGAAKRFYEKSCAISDDFPACDFARNRLKELE
ncbi:TPR repeat protein [Rhizobium herbae]|uniref:TPR repeat protein n=2 Tax=Rhizobium herbae TaxID=508661 RepID=A0ABS4EHR0_9HYPH|nr:TPR repeat protein [Rhizobium herbae]